MADYILIRQEMPDKREVDQIATQLGIDFDSVIGKLVRFWLWAQRQRIDCNTLDVTPAFLDRLTNCQGFTVALVDVGWLTNRNGRLYAPDFDRYNGQTAIRKALTKDRVKDWRAKNGRKTCNTDCVTDENRGSLSTNTVDSSSTGEKKTKKAREFVEYPKAFEEFWRHYPLKTAKEAALRAWVKAGKRIRKQTGKDSKAAAEVMRAAAEAFAASDKAKGEFCPHPATWLNKGHYSDDPAAWKERGTPKPKDFSIEDVDLGPDE